MMSYPTYLIKTLPATLWSSTGLAILVSLGIHGILWKVLQVLPIDLILGKGQLPRTVGLVELTPGEQRLLPQVSQPPVTLPAFATQSSSILPPLQPEPYPRILQPPLVNLPSVWSGLPPAPLGNNQSITQSIPIPENPPSVSPGLLPVPTGNNQPITQSIPIPEQPPSVSPGSLPIPSGNNQSIIPLVPIPGSLPSDLNQRVRYRPYSSASDTLSRLKPANVADAVHSQTKPSAASTRLSSTPELWTRAKLVAALRGTPPKRSSVSTSAATTTSTRLSSTPEHWTREKLVAALQREQPQPNSASTSAVTTTSTRLASTPELWTRAKLVAALWGAQPEHNSGSTSAATAQRIAQVNDFKQWYQKVHSSNPKLETKAPIRQKIKTCQKQLDGGVAVFGMVVNPEGKIISGPDFMPKNGAANIQQAAKNYVKRYRFRRTLNATEQPFRLEFEYDSSICYEPAPKPSFKHKYTQQPQS